MQKWEYCAVHPWGKIVYYTDQGSREDETFKKSREKAIAFLGEQGWEAFAVDSGMWLFKRPKPYVEKQRADGA
jgi:hypothetical protein